MGLFSKTCAKTYLPVVHSGRGYPILHHVVALTPDGQKHEGPYDGYGRVNEVELCTDYDKWLKTKFVLANAYAGETYDELGESHDELGQGHFMRDEFLIYCVTVGSFKDYAAYKRMFKKLAGWI